MRVERALPPPLLPETFRRPTTPAARNIPKTPVPPPVPEAALRKRTPTPTSVETGPRLLRLASGEATHASPNHPQRNEDAAFYSTARGIGFVADGMGGAPAGELASGAAASILDRSTLQQLETSATNEQDALAMRLVRRVYEADVATPLTRDAVEAATRELMSVMNDQIEINVQTNPRALDRAAEYCYERKEISASRDPQTGMIDRSRLSKHDQDYVRLAASTIGTTASLHKVWRDREGKPFVTIGNVGDSRTYLFRDGTLVQLSEDHSPITTLKKLNVRDTEGNPLSDEEESDQEIDRETLLKLAETHPELQHAATKAKRLPGKAVSLRSIRNIITSALGNASINKRANQMSFEPNISTHSLREGDILISCTDGLIDNRIRSRIEEITRLYQHQGPQAIAKALVDDAYHASLQPNGKKDDIRVVATDIRFAN